MPLLNFFPPLWKEKFSPPLDSLQLVPTIGLPIITLKSTFEINNAVLIMDEKCSTSHRKSANIAYYQTQVRIYKSNGIWQSTSPRFTRIQPIRINEKRVNDPTTELL